MKVQYFDPEEDHLVNLLLSLKAAANAPVDRKTVDKQPSSSDGSEHESDSGNWEEPNEGTWQAYTEELDPDATVQRGKLADTSTKVLKRWLFE
jgi:hypothetical protein